MILGVAVLNLLLRLTGFLTIPNISLKLFIKKNIVKNMRAAAVRQLMHFTII